MIRRNTCLYDRYGPKITQITSNTKREKLTHTDLIWCEIRIHDFINFIHCMENNNQSIVAKKEIIGTKNHKRSNIIMLTESFIVHTKNKDAELV